MYRGEDVCLSHVGDFQGECISRTANTAGPHLFYFRKKKYTSQAVCSSVIQMWNAWCSCVWADSLCGKSFTRESIMCATLVSRREKKDQGRCIPFFICFCCIIMTMSRASRQPSQMQLVVSVERDVLSCLAGCVWMRTSRCHQSWWASMASCLGDLTGHVMRKLKPAYLVIISWSWPELKVLRGYWTSLTSSHPWLLTVITSYGIALGCSLAISGFVAWFEWIAVDNIHVCHLQ